MDDNPAVGSVYWDTSGTYGHVAWVSAVNGDDVTIEEYNRWPYNYAYYNPPRTVNRWSASGYIHIADISQVATKVNVGDDFYAFIKHTKTWQGLVAKGYNVCVEKAENKPEHRWHFQRQSDGSYKITSVKDGKCMEVENFGTANGTNVALNDNYNGNTAQRWNIYGESGAYRFAGVCGTNVMDLDGGANVDGTNIQMWENYGGENQLFAIWEIDYPELGTTEAWTNGSTYASKDNVEIAWKACNNADGYDIRIYKEDGNTLYYKNPFYIKGTSFKMTLPKGVYQVSVAALNSSFGNFKIGSKSRIVVDGLENRSVKLDKIADRSGNNIQISWDKCDGAIGYDVRVFSSDGNTQQKIFYTKDVSTLSIPLSVGSYQINVAPVNEKFKTFRFGPKSKIEITEHDIVKVSDESDDNASDSQQDNEGDSTTGHNDDINTDIDYPKSNNDDISVDPASNNEDQGDDVTDSGEIDISDLDIRISGSYTYTGKPIIPTVRIYDDGSILKLNRDYAMACLDNVDAGTATILLEGTGNYTGEEEKSFTIKAFITEYHRKAFRFSHRSGRNSKDYRIRRYAKTGSFKSGAKTARTTSTLKYIKKLSKRKWYVRVRTYKKIGKKKYYSSWSRSKTITVKK